MAPSKRRRLENIPMSDAVSPHSRTRSNPTFKLNNDILGCIFTINADMDLDKEGTAPALATLQCMSQVCSNWRDLAVGTPTLWARVLDFEFLWRKKAAWRQEVVHRTGQTAPLDIKVSLGNRTKPKMQIVEKLLKNHWTRIRSLKLQFDAFFRPTKNSWVHLLERPAPNMEAFIYSWNDDWQIFDPTFILFANDAPKLQKLSVADMKLNLATLRAPNLLHLTSSLSIPWFDLLGALGNMTSLKSLTLKSPDRAQTTNGLSDMRNFPEVHLPHLDSIKLLAVPSPMSLLAHIIPRKGCVLELLDIGLEFANHPGADEYFRVLSTFSQHCSQLETATTLSVALEHRKLHISVVCPGQSNFFIRLLSRCYVQDLLETIVSSFINSFATLQPHKIQTLNLSLGQSQAIRSNPDVTNFLQALASVEYLASDTQTLASLQIIQSSCPSTLIPALKTVWIETLIPWHQRNLVTDFLRSRIRRGVPVCVLAARTGPQNTMDLSPLMDICGLTVQIDTLPQFYDTY